MTLSDMANSSLRPLSCNPSQRCFFASLAGESQAASRLPSGREAPRRRRGPRAWTPAEHAGILERPEQHQRLQAQSVSDVLTYTGTAADPVAATDTAAVADPDTDTAADSGPVTAADPVAAADPDPVAAADSASVAETPNTVRRPPTLRAQQAPPATRTAANPANPSLCFVHDRTVPNGVLQQPAK